jgi:GT2 family glycosyltransferase
VRGLTIAVCTRDRPADLARCLRSVTRARFPRAAGFVHVLVVDDGALAAPDVEALGALVGPWGARFAYARVAGARGLFGARLAARDAAEGEVILFLDDDVEIGTEYLTRLVARYTEWPDAAGIGGVDELTRPYRFVRRVFDRVFLFDSGHAGRLSPSGFTSSIRRWSGERAAFPSEYLSGSNMSFRREALRPVAVVHWLEGYSLGEDVYLSHVARGSGPLWVDPALAVQHHRSPAARVADGALAYVTVMNPYRLLVARQARWWNYLALVWTTLGLLLKDAVRPHRWRVLPAYARSIREVVRQASAGGR